MKAAVLVAVMALVTMLLRFLPFLIFRREAPPYIVYLGKVLPPATVGMLVIYCFRNTAVFSAPFGIPELIASAAVVAVHIWKRNVLASILTGTVVYMLLIQMVF